MADKGVELLGDNLAKVPAIMSDNAAKDVAAKMFVEKKRLVALLKTHEDDFTDEELEVMATNFVDTCITHTGDLASKKHHTMMENAINEVIISYNAATMLQRFFALRCRRSLHQKARRQHAAATLQRFFGVRSRVQSSGDVPDAKRAWLSLFSKLWADRLGRHRFITPMKLSSRTTDLAKEEKYWQVTGEVKSVYSLMCSMSNLISNQGRHSQYYLNEHKDFRLFWVSL